MKITSRGDTLAAEQVLHTVQHDPGYQVICERILEAARQAARDLVTAKIEDVPRLQERVQSLEMVLALPKQIIAELRRKQ